MTNRVLQIRATLSLAHTVVFVRSSGSTMTSRVDRLDGDLNHSFAIGQRCFIPASTPNAILISLPPSPLAAGLTQVFAALDVACTLAQEPTQVLLDAATLWICDDASFAAAQHVPRTLRVAVFASDSSFSSENVEIVHPTTPTSRLLDLAAAWSTVEVTSLSPREREILSMVSRGLSNEEIAAACFVSTATIKTHLLRSFRKLGVSDRAAAVYKAVKMGLIV